MQMMRHGELESDHTLEPTFLFCWRSMFERIPGHPVGIEELACVPVHFVIRLGAVNCLKHGRCLPLAQHARHLLFGAFVVSPAYLCARHNLGIEP